MFLKRQLSPKAVNSAALVETETSESTELVSRTPLNEYRENQPEFKVGVVEFDSFNNVVFAFGKGKIAFASKALGEKLGTIGAKLTDKQNKALKAMVQGDELTVFEQSNGTLLVGLNGGIDTSEFADASSW